MLAACLTLGLIIRLICFSCVVEAAPSIPTNLSAVVMDGGQIKLSWDDNSLDEIGFIIEWGTSDIDEVFVINRVSFNLPANAVNFTDNTVAPATTYYSVCAGGSGL